MKKASPPKLLLRFFKWFCHRDLHIYVEGDLLELYREKLFSSGKRKADLRFSKDVMLLFRPSIIRPFEGNRNSTNALFKNYYKTAIRSLMKNPLSSFINIFGLSAAIAVCIFAYSFTNWAYSIDQFHENKNEIYLTTIFVDRDGTLQQNGLTPRPLGKMLKEDFAHIKNVCRVDDRNVIVKYDEKVFHERVRYIDPEFLEMFTFPIKWGLSSSLSDVNSVILSEQMSIKYFGYKNPIGFNLLVKFDDSRSKTFTIKGVAEAFPAAHDLEFDFLINFENFHVSEPNLDFNDWSSFINATLIQVEHPSDLRQIEAGMEKYRALQNEVQSDWAISSFAFEQWAGLYHKSGDIKSDISGGSDSNAISVLFIAAVSFFLLLLACFNYMNIAIVSATKRLKEIGVRKTIGATRKAVIVQFLVENIFVTAFALFFGVILGSGVVIPWFEQINNFNMDFTLYDPGLWIYLPSILLFTAIVSGAYPAVCISKFQVIGILRGTVKFGKKNPITKVFLGIQITLACIFIATASMFTQNYTYMEKRSWGYNQDETLYVRIRDYSAFEQLNGAMSQDPKVLLTSGSGHHVGKSIGNVVIQRPDRQYEVDQLKIDSDYFETMGIHLKEGRNFKKNHESDKQAVVVNEALLVNLNVKEVVGQVVKIDTISYEIIGVVKDFHSSHFNQKIRPTIFMIADQDEYRYLSLKVRSGKEYETYKSLQKQWSRLFPEIPFQGGYQEDVWGPYFRNERYMARCGVVWRPSQSC